MISHMTEAYPVESTDIQPVSNGYFISEMMVGAGLGSSQEQSLGRESGQSQKKDGSNKTSWTTYAHCVRYQCT